MTNKAKHDALLKTIETAKTELAQVKSDLHLENLQDDITIKDDIDNLHDTYDQGNFTETARFAANIYHKISSGKILNMDADPLKEISEYVNSDATQHLPPRFKLGVELVRGKLIMIGGLPKAGKTTLACNIAYYNSITKKKTLFLTYEMSTVEIWIKLFMLHIYDTTGKSPAFLPISSAIRKQEDEQQKRTFEAFKTFVKQASNHIMVLDAATYPPSIIGIAIERTVNYFGKIADFTIPDYAQLIPAEPNMKNDTFRERMLYASQYLASKAKATDTNIIVLSQMNKEGGYKESGGFEENAAMNMTLESIKDEKDKLTNSIKINVKSSRFTGAPHSTVYFDRRSGWIGQ